jgi:tRNA-specific 2-thiouridylase
MFPLGEMQKPAVRVMAAEAGLAVATKSDSQEICFIPGGDYNTFLKAYLDEQKEAMPDTAGELVTTTGEVIGHHAGIQSFTVGQRKGLGVTSPDPLYVLAIHPDSHRVTVGSDDDLRSRDLFANRLNWISIPGLGEGETIRVAAKIRHRHPPAMATLSRVDDDTVHAYFDEPQRAITPGQSAVFYQEDEVVGGGWII